MIAGHDVIADVDLPAVVKISNRNYSLLLEKTGEREKVWALFGSLDKEAVISKIVELNEVVSRPGYFVLNPAEWMWVIIREVEKGTEYVGLAHQHFHGMDKPSPIDLKYMMECPGEIWLISSISYRRVSAWGWGRRGLERIELEVT